MRYPLGRSDLDALGQLDTPTVVNAVEPFNVRGNTEGYMGWDIRCLFPELGVMVGYAVTATLDTMTPGRARSQEPLYRLLEAVRDSPHPAVLVLKDIGPRPHHGCHFGDEIANICLKLGAIGLVTDGGVRDIDAVRKLGFHYFAHGMVAGHGNFAFVDTQVTVEVSGLVVNPGDLIHADVNGVVSVPLEIAPQVIEGAQALRRREAENMAWTNSDDFSVEALRERGLGP